MRPWPALIALMLMITPAYALTMKEASGEKTMTIEDYITDFVDIPEGGIDWKIFGTTDEIEAHGITEEGYDNYYSKPIFQPAVSALNNQEIKIKGFMFPLDSAEEQKTFLFGPFPLSCPFQYHVGPSLVIEVHTDKDPITFDFDPITITGTLELVHDDPEYSVFYRLNNAKLAK